MWILSLEKSMCVFDFFIAFLLNSKAMSVSIACVVKSISFPALCVGIEFILNFTVFIILS